jgi:carboxypeptidase C (cathepsin A)
LNAPRAAALRSSIAALLFAAVVGSAAAEPPKSPPAPSRSSWPEVTLNAQDGPRRFETRHKGVFGGKPISYTALVSETIVKDAQGRPAASVFTTSFVADGVGDAAARPVIFIYNGGPGGASNTLLFGAMGPRRMARFDSPAQADPTVPLVDNPDSPLDSADLVFIDPPETGFGRMLPGVDKTTFRGNDADSFACGQVILRWLADHGRLGSPVYLAGESYGTLRNVLLARDLSQASPSVQVAGLIMISQAIRYNGPDSIVPARNRDILESINRFPDAAAFAWYHGKIDNKTQTLAQAIAKAQDFARTDYAQALILGNRLDAAGRRRIAERMAELTGLPASYYLDRQLRPADVRRDLLRNEGKLLGQFDGRETEPAAGAPQDRDRDWAKAVRGLTLNMERYAAQDLRVKGLGDYLTLVPDPYGFEDTWKYIAPGRPLQDTVLTEQMHANPKLRLLVPQGVFDSTSSMGSTLALFAQLDIPAERVIVTYYPGGHMLYTDPAGREAFTSDIRAFVSGKTPTHTAIPDVQPAP